MSAPARTARTTRLFAVSLAFLVLVVGTLVVVRAESGKADTPTPGPSLTPVASPLTIEPVKGATFVPALQGKRPLFILLLGSDARPGQPVEKERADSIHIIGVNLKTQHATILGIPRDSWVTIPGHGTDKINAALSDGGPQLVVKTVESVTGIPIDFYAITSFVGLTNMVNSLGGVTVRVTQPMHDQYSRANFNPGVQHLNGTQALEYARDRHSFLNGDLTRSGNQGILMLSALSKFQKTFWNDPWRMFAVLRSVWVNVHTTLSPEMLYRLALTATQVKPANVNNFVVPATTGMQGAESVVFISPSAKALYTQMKRTGTISRPPKQTQ
ncbi:MAG TPA: LCP family protein [Actinomycetota bacterium]|nr:LCP family protein [Actinomycetota bacterium]